MLSSISSRFKSLNLPRSLLSQIQNVLNFHSLPPHHPSFSAKPSKHNSYFHPNNPKSASNSLQKIYVSTKSVDLDQTTVLETLSCYSNDWKRALEFFNWVGSECGFEHSTETHNRMIDILGKLLEFDLSWDLIKLMRKKYYSIPNHITFRILFKRYVSAHLVKEAISTYDRMEEFNLKDELSFSNLVDALCEYKHVIEAEEMCLGKNSNRGVGFYSDTKIYSMILCGWFKMGWWSKFREFWEEMDRRGVCTDLHLYSIYMDIQCKSGKPWKAMKLYKEMKKKGIELDVVAYNTVVAMGRSEGIDFAIRLYREMMELGCTIRL